MRLGGRALEILITLVERAGELVSKEELVERVWPGVRVEEGNLRVHVAALRRVLGDGGLGERYLATEPGRGYRFVAPLAIRSSSSAEDRGPVARLPAAVRTIGRDECVRILVEELAEHRLSTVAGPGGMGKTTVALAVARQLVASFEHVELVDLSSLVDGAQLPSVIASALGLPEDGLIAALRAGRTLLVLDNCEQVVAAAAEWVERVLRETSSVHVLATSREPLRASAERVHRLPPLGLPLRSQGLTAAQALGYPAVQLFVERAAARVDGFTLSNADAPFVAEICRRVDGLALAIELCAGSVGRSAIAEISALLDVSLPSLTGAPRHQTLRATLDWSHELLPIPERRILRRLGVFAGWFELEVGYAVAGEGSTWPEFADIVAELVSKSLIVTDVSGSVAECRLLETTRAYALEKLEETGEAHDTRARHARLQLALVEGFIPEAAAPDAGARLLENVRLALDWAFGTHGDRELGCALTVATLPVWRRLSLMEECLLRVKQALATSLDVATPRQSMELHAALGVTLLSSISADNGEIRQALSQALRLAEELEDVDHQLRALWGLWLAAFHIAQHRMAVVLAGRFRVVAEEAGRRNDASIGLRMKAVSLSLLGELAEARLLIERMLDEYEPPRDRADALRFQFVQEVIGRATLVVVAMQRGEWDLAQRVSDRAVELALEAGHALSLCDVLAQAVVPVALLRGDLQAAEKYITLLLSTAEQHRLDLWHAWGRCFRGMLLIARGQIETGLVVFGAALDDLPKTRFVPRHTALLARFADGLRRAGRVDEGMAAIERALSLVERTQEHWAVPELLRVQGELVLAGDLADRHERAAQLFRRASRSAEQMGALAWELRAATSLAHLLHLADRNLEARDVLAPVYARCTEGADTRDLKHAVQLLEEISRSARLAGVE